MQFQKLSIDDIDRIAPYFQRVRSRTCDFTIGGMFMWRDYYRMEYCLADGVFYSRLFDEQARPYYNLPVGDNLRGAIHRVVAFEKRSCPVVRFCTIPEEYLPAFEQEDLLSETEEQASYFDYLYLASDLKELGGKKYGGQRNLISQFKRANEDWRFEELSPERLEAVRAFFRSAYRVSPEAAPFEREENAKTLEVLENWSRYGLQGGVLYAGEAIVGFSIGEILHDTLYTHIEKADRNVKGAYQMLVNQFSMKYARDGICYINREEDMGDPGLRRAKEAYHPTSLLKKYCIEVRGSCKSGS